MVEQRCSVRRMGRKADRLGIARTRRQAPLAVSDQAVAVRQHPLRDERQEAVGDGAGADQQQRLTGAGDFIGQVDSIELGDFHVVFSK